MLELFLEIPFELKIIILGGLTIMVAELFKRERYDKNGEKIKGKKVI